MERTAKTFAAAGFLLTFGLFGVVLGQNLPVAHWINDAGVNADSALNSEGVFVTNFKSTNDLTVTRVSPNAEDLYLYTDEFGSGAPGNNPWYITQFTGLQHNGTGEETPGSFVTLGMTWATTGSLQFDFRSPLTSRDRILLADIDGTEGYSLQAFVLEGSSYSPVNLAGWRCRDYSGATGEMPNSTWPAWNAAAGTLNSGASLDLDDDLVVLRPDQSIDRLVISKTNGESWSSGIQFLSLSVPLTIQQAGANVVVSWPVAFSNLVLSVSDTLGGHWKNMQGTPQAKDDSWVVTNAASAEQRFFRLEGPPDLPN